MVEIRLATGDDYPALVAIYKRAFKNHNVLHGPGAIQFLKDRDKQNRGYGGGLLVALKDKKIVGGVLVRFKRKSADGAHYSWRYNHLAVSPDNLREGIGRKLMDAADNLILGAIKAGKFKTAKVELTVAEDESKSVDFFEVCGFELEGKMKSHHRWGELSYYLGKELIN